MAADQFIPQGTGFTMLDQNGRAVTFKGSGIAFAGEFDGNLANGDEVGLFDGTHFFLDSNHNFVIDPGDTVITTQLQGFPIIGDFNGDGITDLGTWKTDLFYFNFGTQPGDARHAASPTAARRHPIHLRLPRRGEIPLAADMDGDGITDVGLWVPGRAGTVGRKIRPKNSSCSPTISMSLASDAEFRCRRPWTTRPDMPRSAAFVGSPDPTISVLNHPFSPFPLGHRFVRQSLDEFATPIVGNFDPPLAPTSAAAAGDTTAPSSSVSALPATTSTKSFNVSWSGSDNSGGSGIASYDVYVSDNGGNFASWLTGRPARRPPSTARTVTPTAS